MDSSDESTVTPLLHNESHLLFDTVCLIALRIVYIFLARRFLLSTLNPTLRDLSKSDDLLPLAVTTSMGGLPHSSNLSEHDLDAELDTEDDRNATPASPSPIRSPGPIASSSKPPLSRRNTDDSFVPGHASTLSTIPEAEGSDIPLQNLGRKLKMVGAEAGQRLNVLRLNHGKRDAGGTKVTKKATRSLSTLSRALFALCFAEACTLLSLVMFHALGILHSHSRHINFSISLHVVLTLILLIVPLVQCLLLTYRERPMSSTNTSIAFTTRALIALLPFALYVFAFTRIPPYVTTQESVPDTHPADRAEWSAGPEGWEKGGWLAASLGRVVVLGIVVLGCLSGFGAIRTAWGFLEHARGGILSDRDIIQAERSLYRVRQDLVLKQDELSKAPDRQSGSSWSRVFGTKEDRGLQAEVQGLTAMERQIARSVSAMKLRRKRQVFTHTLRGKVYQLAGYIFAVYCAARLTMCLPSILFPPVIKDESVSSEGDRNGDWISFVLALGLSHLPTGPVDIDVAVWSRAISLLLAGLLILSSLTQVLRSLSKVLRLTSKTVGAGFLVLSLGQLFATYVISLLVQLRTSLPPPPASEADLPFHGNTTMTTLQTNDSLLATLPDFKIFGRLFDIVFLCTAVGTGLYRYVSIKVNAADDSGDVYRY